MHAVATMPALRAVDLDLCHSGCTLCVEELSPALMCLSQLAFLRLNGSGIGANDAAALAQLLGTLTALTALSLAENKFGEDGVEALAPALTRLSRLAALDLSCLGIGRGVDGAATLLEPLGALTALTALDLSDNNLYLVAADGALTRALSCLPRLANLRLANADIGGDTDIMATADELAEHLGGLSTLTALNLCGNYLGPVVVQALAPALRRLPRLAALDLQRNFIEAADTAALAMHLSALTTLTALCLSGEKYYEDDGKMIVSSIEALPPALSCLSHLADLRLSGYSIDASEAAALVATLCGLTALTRLHLCYTEFDLGDGGTTFVRLLAPALSRLSRLSELGLAGNSLGTAGAAALALQLASLTTLTLLSLGENDFGDAAAEALAPALSRLSQLADLDLRCNGIGAAAAAMARSLAALTMLTSLNLCSAELGDAGAEALAPALSRLCHLQHLWLSCNSLSDKSLGCLARALACLANLSELDMRDGQGFSRDAVAQFRARLQASGTSTSTARDKLRKSWGAYVETVSRCPCVCRCDMDAVPSTWPF